MSYQVVCRDFMQLSFSERRRLRQLTLKDGTMKELWYVCQANCFGILAFIAFSNSNIVGWASMEVDQLTGIPQPFARVGVFVKPNHRHRGVGSLLLIATKDFAHNKGWRMAVNPNEDNISFFKSILCLDEDYKPLSNFMCEKI